MFHGYYTNLVSQQFAGPAAQDIGSVVRLSSGETTLLSQILSRLEGLEFMDCASAVQLMKIAIRLVSYFI